MTNFEHLKNETRTFDGMLDTLSKMWAAGGSGCILDGELAGGEIECPSDCDCRRCIETWLSSERREFS